MTESALEYVEANGVRFAYLAEGQGPLVLLVHGFPDTPHTWDHVRPALAAAGYRAVSPFTRGYAPTEIPKDGAYDADTLGRDVSALITALGEEQAIVIGHDWGAGAAYSASAMTPEKIRLLVTLAIPHPAGVKFSPRMLWTVRHFLTLQLPGAVKRVAANDFAEIDMLVRRWSPAWDVPAGETDAVKRVFREEGSLDAALGYYRAISPRLPASQRKRVTVPTVAFAGEDDVISPDVYEGARSRFASSYDVVRMPGGHFMHREHPAIFERELLAALAKFEKR